MNTMRAVLNSLLVLGLFYTAYVFGITHDAPKGGWLGTPADVARAHDGKPVNEPVFTKADRATHCTPKKTHEIHTTVLVVKQDATRTRMDFDTAWERNKNDNSGDDIWVIGFC